MLARILLPVDGSAPSSRAVEAVREIATAAGSEVLVLHLREREAAPMGVFDLEGADAAEEIVDRAVRTLKEAGVSVTSEVRTTVFGHAARDILREARTAHAEMIVMGSRGRSQVGTVLLGSVTQRVIHGSPVPVLVVR